MFKIITELSNGTFLIERDGKKGVITKDGKDLVLCKYDKIYIGLYNKYFITELDRQFGLVDNDCNEILDCKYFSITEVESEYPTLKKFKVMLYSSSAEFYVLLP